MIEKHHSNSEDRGSDSVARPIDLVAEVAQSLTIQDLPGEDVREAATVVGVENALRLATQFGGITFIFPKKVGIFLKRLYVQKHYDGKNVRSLAFRLGIAERTIYQWVREPAIKTGKGEK